MDLRERKIINNGAAAEKLPEYAEGKWLHGASQQSMDGMVTQGINFLGQTVNSFGPVKSSSDILTESGTSVGQGSGFSYQKQNAVDAGAQMDELSKQNTANTLQTAAAGASLGSAFGPIGAGIGGVVGGAVGFVGGLFRKNKMRDRIKEAQLQAVRNNNFSLASAQTDYLTNQYNVEHDNTQDDRLYQAKDGKLPGFVNGFDGRARISNGEIYGHVDRFGNVLDMHRAGSGKDNKDSLIRRLGNTPDEFNRAFVVTNKGGASDYVAATGDVQGGLEIGNAMKDFRTVLQLHNDAFNKLNQGYKCGKHPKYEDQKEPKTTEDEYSERIKAGWAPLFEGEAQTGTISNQYTPKLNFNLTRPYALYKYDNTDYTKLTTPDLTYKPLQLGGFLSKSPSEFFSMKPGKTYGEDNTNNNNDNSNLANAITSGLGILGGLTQYMHKDDKLNTPDIYAANPYERQALDIYGWLSPATNRAVQAAAATEARNRYNINRMGGLSGAQKYLAAVQSGVGLQKNIADIIADTQMQRNQLKSQLAGAMLNTGAQDAQRRMSANQYMDEAYARAHGARTQFEQMGMQNMLAAFQQYYKNLEKNNRFMRTMAYYDQDYQLRKDALKKGFYV